MSRSGIFLALFALAPARHHVPASPESGEMNSMRRSRVRRDHELQVIPGIGPSLAADLRDLGIRYVADLKRRDPERMYQQLNTRRGVRQDPCVLYVFRCAVYFARTTRPKPDLLKWWNWKHRRLAGRTDGQA